MGGSRCRHTWLLEARTLFSLFSAIMIIMIIIPLADRV